MFFIFSEVSHTGKKILFTVKAVKLLNIVVNENKKVQNKAEFYLCDFIMKALILGVTLHSVFLYMSEKNECVWSSQIGYFQMYANSFPFFCNKPPKLITDTSFFVWCRLFFLAPFGFRVATLELWNNRYILVQFVLLLLIQRLFLLNWKQNKPPTQLTLLRDVTNHLQLEKGKLGLILWDITTLYWQL